MQPSSIAVLLDLDAAAAYKRGRLLEMVPTMYIFGFSNHTGIPSRNTGENVGQSRYVDSVQPKLQATVVAPG